MKYILLLFLLVSCTNEMSIREENCNRYIQELKEMGYSSQWAIHKARVEYGFEPIDDEYWAIIED